MKNPLSPLFIGCALLSMSNMGRAISVVNYDGTAGISGATLANISLGGFTNTGDSNYGGGAATDRRGTRFGFTTGTPMLAPSAEYTGPAIYGGYESILIDAASGNVLNGPALVETSATNVTARVSFNNTSAYAATSSGIAAVSGSLYFLTSGAGISFNSLSTLSLTTGAAGGNLDARWLVRDGGVFYVSLQTFASTANTLTTLTDPNSMTWAVYSPTSTLINFNQSVAFSAHTFTNVQGAGVYFENDAVNTTSPVSTMDLLKFSVDAVPEPSGVSLAAGAGLLMLCRQNRKR